MQRLLSYLEDALVELEESVKKRPGKKAPKARKRPAARTGKTPAKKKRARTAPRKKAAKPRTAAKRAKS